MKFWDVRKFGQCMKEIKGLQTFYEQTGLDLSPDGSLVITGTSVKKGEGGGLLVFYDMKTFEQVQQIGVSEGSVIAMRWHPKLNQIVVGTSTGDVKVYYSERYSRNGALLCVKKAPRKQNPMDILSIGKVGEIITPGHIDIHNGPRNRKRKRDAQIEKSVRLQSLEMRPQMPNPNGETGLGGGWASSALEGVFKKDLMREEDPRVAILRHAEEAAANPIYTSAYAKTQPEPIFTREDDSEEEDDTFKLKRAK